MQSDCTYSDFGTVDVGAMLAFLAQGKEIAAAFLSVYSVFALSTYNGARCDINLPGRLDWVKFVSSSRPIRAGLVVS